MKKRTAQHLFLSFLCGLVAALPLLFSIPFLSFLLFAPYAYYLKTREKETRLRFYYASGLFFYFGYFFLAFSFFSAMYPLDFAGLDTLGSIAVLFAAMVLLPLFQAWFAAFSILLLGLFARRGWLRFPCAFSLTLGALYTLFAYAQNLTWAGVPWANTAAGLTAAPILIQSASLFGSSFLVFLVITCSALLAEALDAFRACRDKQALIALSLAFCLFFSNLFTGAILLGIEHDAKSTVKVGLIQGCAPSTENTLLDSNLRTCRYEALRLSREEEVDVMLWSESVLNYALESSKAKQTFLSNVAEETGVIQIVGAFSARPTPDGEDGYYNALFVFYPDGSVGEDIYAKRRPVPFGEYLPMAELFRVLIPALTEISMLSRDTTPGEDAGVLELPLGSMGGLICFDSIYPALARDSAKDGAELFLLSTDDSWFDGSFAKSLHLAHARLRAVENGRWVARTGNTGISGIINSKGELIYTLPADEIAHGAATVSLSGDTTLYTQIGDVIILVFIAYLFLLPSVPYVKQRIKHRKEKHHE